MARCVVLGNEAVHSQVRDRAIELHVGNLTDHIRQGLALHENTAHDSLFRQARKTQHLHHLHRAAMVQLWPLGEQHVDRDFLNVLARVASQDHRHVDDAGEAEGGRAPEEE